MLRPSSSRSLTRRLLHKRYASTTTITTRSSTVELLSDLNQLLQQQQQQQQQRNQLPGVVSETWLNRLNHTVQDLQRGEKRNNRISIVGDLESGVQKLSNSILDDDPLSNNQQVTLTLQTRSLVNPPPEQLTLQYHQPDQTVGEGSEVIVVDAKWLKENQTSLTEIIHGDETSPLTSSQTSLHLSDTVILLLSSTKLLLGSKPSRQLLLDLNLKPNLIVCVNTQRRDASNSTAEEILKTLQHQLDTLLPPPSTRTPNRIVIAVSTEQALNALSLLNDSTTTTSSSDSEGFQTGYLSSQIPKLKTILSEILLSSKGEDLQKETSFYIFDSTLSKTLFNLINLKDTLSTARSTLEALSQQTSESSQKLLSQSVGIDSRSNGMFPLPEQELLESKQEIEKVFRERLQFYKLPFNKIDDISSELSLTISQSYLTSFEKQLIYSTSLFSNHSFQLSTILSSTLSKPPFSKEGSSILYSPLLENELSKSLHSSSTTLIPPTALTTPLSLRRSQLLSTPLTHLHRQTQRALTSSLTLSITSIASAIGLHFVHLVELTNCVGLGVLGSVLAVWKFQGKWERLKKRFLKEVDRVGQGISEDLGVVTKRLIERSEYPTRLAIRQYSEKIIEKQLELESFENNLKEISKRRERVTSSAREEEVRRKNKEEEGKIDIRFDFFS
ncbi:hypothetical protein JCM5350_006615 [Sporobolomyces pararoseus]